MLTAIKVAILLVTLFVLFLRRMESDRRENVRRECVCMWYV